MWIRTYEYIKTLVYRYTRLSNLAYALMHITHIYIIDIYVVIGCKKESYNYVSVWLIYLIFVFIHKSTYVQKEFGKTIIIIINSLKIININHNH